MCQQCCDSGWPSGEASGIFDVDLLVSSCVVAEDVVDVVLEVRKVVDEGRSFGHWCSMHALVPCGLIPFDELLELVCLFCEEE